MSALLSVGTLLQLLQAVPKAVAAEAEFKRVWGDIVAAFDGHRSQAELQAAYDAAISDAADAHQDLQEIVARNS